MVTLKINLCFIKTKINFRWRLKECCPVSRMHEHNEHRQSRAAAAKEGFGWALGMFFAKTLASVSWRYVGTVIVWTRPRRNKVKMSYLPWGSFICDL